MKLDKYYILYKASASMITCTRHRCYSGFGWVSGIVSKDKIIPSRSNDCWLDPLKLTLLVNPFSTTAKRVFANLFLFFVFVICQRSGLLLNLLDASQSYNGEEIEGLTLKYFGGDFDLVQTN